MSMDPAPNHMKDRRRLMGMLKDTDRLYSILVISCPQIIIFEQSRPHYRSHWNQYVESSNHFANHSI